MISGLIVLVPLLGAGVLWLLREQPARVHWGASVGLSAVNLSLIAGLAPQMPAEFVLSSWRPPALFQAQLHLILDRSSWAFVMASSVLLLSLYLVSASRPGADNPTTRVISMIYFGLAASAFMAGNTVTVALTWALVDVASFLFLLAAAEDFKTVDGLTKRFGLQAVSVLLIVASAFPIAASRGDVESAVRPALMVAAVFFRIGLFPIQTGLPSLPEARRGLGALVRLLPAAMGLAVLSRQLPSAPPTGLQVALLLLGGFSVAVGGFRWAMTAGRIEGRRYLVLTFAGLAAAVGSLGGSARLALVGVGAAMILVGGALFELVVHQRWHRSLAYLAALAAVGIPPTAGHLALRMVGGRPWPSGSVPLLVLIALGLLLLPAGALRMAGGPRAPWESGEPLVRGAYGLGLALPAIAAVPIGLVLQARPTTQSALQSLALLLLGLAAGYAGNRWSIHGLATALERTSGSFEAAPRLLGTLWSNTLHRSAALMRGLGRILEGRAAMLWVYVIILFVALVATGRGG